jgi:hypothetical protein
MALGGKMNKQAKALWQIEASSNATTRQTSVRD